MITRLVGELHIDWTSTGGHWQRALRLGTAAFVAFGLIAALWLLLRPPTVLAQAGAPATFTPVEVRNEAGALQPALVLTLRNGCHDPTLTAVTNPASYPILLDLAPGDCLLALTPQRFVTTTKEFHAYPLFAPFGATGNIAYVIVNTNWTIGPAGAVISPTVASPGAPILLTTRADAPLALFNLVASLEWDAHEAAELAVFSDALAAFGADLFDASNGQMTLGRALIVAGAQHWRDADFQIMAGNDVWPNADVGGITAVVTQLGNGIGFRPGHLRVGRGWDGNSANQGPWNQPTGARTLVHEFGHYGLALFDEYLGLAPDGTDFSSFCTISPSDPAYAADWASLMSYQYKANEFALRREGNPMQWTGRCRQTIQFQMYNLSDWETLASRFGDSAIPPRWQIQIPANGPNPGPEVVPPGLSAIQITPSPSAPPGRTLTVIGAPPSVGELQVYQFAALNRPSGPRLVSQGVITAGNTLHLLGVYGGDELLVVDPEGVVYTRTVVADPSAALTLSLTAPGWSPNLSLTPSASRQVTVNLSGVGGLSGLNVALIERGSAAPPLNLPLSSHAGISVATFLAPLPDFAGFLHITAQGGLETVAPFALSAGAPSVHDTAHSPRANAHLARTGPAAQQPAILWDARGQPPAPPGQQLIAGRTGFSVAGAATMTDAAADLEAPLALWLNVRDDELPGGRPSCLTLHQVGAGGQGWAPLGLVNELPVHVVSFPVTRTGAFALLRPAGACLFKRVDAPDPVIGAVVTYTIGLDNPNNGWLYGVLVNDPLALVLQPLQISANLPGQMGFNGQNAHWFGDLPPNALLMITITAQIRSGAPLNQVVANQAAAQTAGGTLLSAPVEFRTCARRDINCDGVINLTDIIAAAEAWNATLAGGGFDARFDLDRDGRVTLLDIQTIAGLWGWQW